MHLSDGNKRSGAKSSSLDGPLVMQVVEQT
jgi:hypothetical protein